MKTVVELSENFPARYWQTNEDGRLECRLCPRYCRLSPGQRGFCYVRRNVAGSMALTTYGRSSGFCADPIEKKPLNHFLPGTSVLSFGTAGCNLGCRFCQNWNISKSRSMDQLAGSASPEQIAQAALDAGCHSVAFTYNDPVIFAEYVIDTALACRARGIRTVVVSAGYITEEARADFFRYVDAANIDLKAFSEHFYHKLCFAKLAPVLETLRYLKHETDVWFEITNLMIPGENDSEAETKQLVDWIMANLGPDVPLHFTAFHPDFKMVDKPATPAATLRRAREIALAAGLHFVYVGNVHDRNGSSTYCPNCRELVIERDWFHLGDYRLDEAAACGHCGHKLPGMFLEGKGGWRGQRQRLTF